jgi:biofilm PGA synthesis lipoprotein PgaB
MILMYHNIGDDFCFNTVMTKSFHLQMEYILNNNNYSILSMDEYINNLEKPSIDNPITVTLDDGYRSLKDKVLPIIKAFQIPISVYIPTGFIGSHNVWDTKNGNQKIDISTWDELIYLSKEELVTFGSHGVNHMSHGILDSKIEIYELEKSKEELEKKLDVPIKYFSFPYGQAKDFSRKSIKNLELTGYKAALSTIWARSNTMKNIYSLHRLEILGYDDLNSFIRKLESTIDIGWWKQQMKNIYYQITTLR